MVYRRLRRDPTWLATGVVNVDGACCWRPAASSPPLPPTLKMDSAVACGWQPDTAMPLRGKAPDWRARSFVAYMLLSSVLLFACFSQPSQKHQERGTRERGVGVRRPPPVVCRQSAIERRWSCDLERRLWRRLLHFDQKIR